jgi:serine/threonine protein kinase
MIPLPDFLEINGEMDDQLIAPITLNILKTLRELHSKGVVSKKMEISNILMDPKTAKIMICGAEYERVQIVSFFR